jgi:16S rRNA (adenine1518-N6/adenine1519-N6)-dimethyltransferase
MHIKPKKSLGQNFLVDKNIQNKIIKAADLSGQDLVLEIGSGRGDLTVLLVQKAKQVYALEIDWRLYPLLAEVLNGHKNYQIIKGDILKFDLNKFVKDNQIDQKLIIIGNIPYYITSPIIEYLIKNRQMISRAFLTVQKEFGQRIRAHPGSKEYGSFSCFVQYYAQPQILFEIKRNSFKPVPNVDSCFLSLAFRRHPPVAVADEEAFFKLIRTAFGQRRKTLRNSLQAIVEKKQLEGYLLKQGIDKNVRPEDLSLEQFSGLNNFLNSAT